MYYDNPEPVETEKCFNFEVVITEIKHGYVYAKDEAEARELIEAKKWDEATTYPDTIEVEDISTLLEDK